MGTDIFDVNWIAVIGAALAGFLVGGIWYGPIMGKRWMGAVGLTEEQVQRLAEYAAIVRVTLSD